MTIVRLTTRRVAILPLFVWVCLMPGCIPVDISEVKFRLLIEPDLSGVLEVTAVDVHPLNTTGESVEKAKRVCSSEYEEFGRDFLDDAPLEDLVLKATPTGAATCDVTATGSFEHSPALLAALWSDGEYEIRRSAERLYVELAPRPEDDFSAGSMSVVYGGEVISHNAEDVDKAAGTWTWSFPYISEHGMQFELDLAPASHRGPSD